MRREKGVKDGVRYITLTAMLVAMSVVIGIFCKSVLNFGGGLFRVTFENFPIILSGIILGPVTGGVVGVASDMISYLLSGQTYPPNLLVTLGAFLIGVTSGLVAKYVVKKRSNFQIALAGGIAHVLGSMIVKPIGLFAYYGWAVLWRVPMYFVIAPFEIIIICLLFKNSAFKKLTEGLK